MKTVALNYDEIHEFVDANRNAFWDGWTAVIVNPKRYGLMHKDGIYFKKRWSVAHRVDVDGDGKWRVPVKYA